MLACPRCGTRNTGEAVYCVVCAGPLRRYDPAKEAEHVDYVLAEIPAWRARMGSAQSDGPQDARLIRAGMSERLKRAAIR